jgi:hypothetical protein
MTVTAPGVTARETHNGVALDPDHALATYVPGGFWAVKVRRHHRTWIAYAAPRHGNTAAPFLIATGPDLTPVLAAAIKWRNTATTAVMRMDRIVFAGTGNATDETLPGFDPASLLTEAVTA